jgi:hypothetical protein
MIAKNGIAPRFSDLIYQRPDLFDTCSVSVERSFGELIQVIFLAGYREVLCTRKKEFARFPKKSI